MNIRRNQGHLHVQSRVKRQYTPRTYKERPRIRKHEFGSAVIIIDIQVFLLCQRTRLAHKTDGRVLHRQGVNGRNVPLFAQLVVKKLSYTTVNTVCTDEDVSVIDLIVGRSNGNSTRCFFEGEQALAQVDLLLWDQAKKNVVERRP